MTRAKFRVAWRNHFGWRWCVQRRTLWFFWKTIDYYGDRDQAIAVMNTHHDNTRIEVYYPTKKDKPAVGGLSLVDYDNHLKQEGRKK